MTDADPDASVPGDVDGTGSPEEELPWPVGFLILAGLAAVYVAWRLIQMLGRVIDWFV